MIAKMTDYRIDVYDIAGVLQAQVTDFTALAYIRRLNSAGMLQFSLRGDHPLLTSLAQNWQFEVWRKPEGEAWRRDFIGLYKAGNWYHGENGSRFVAMCPGIRFLLKMRIVNYHAGYDGRSKFTSTPAETVMKTLVRYNITTEATEANGRKRDGTAWPANQIGIEVDGGGGNSVDWYCHGENLMDSLQKLAKIAGGDFDLVKTGATAYEFRWHAGQLGTDRTATVKFSMELGNMADPVYHESHLEEATVACVWGQGEGADREYLTRTGDDYAADNDIEDFISAVDIDQGDTAGLQARGDQKLKELRATSGFSFKAVQAPNCLYGVHYFEGDLVSAVNPFTRESLTQKVLAVSVSLNEKGEEIINPEFGLP